MVDDEASIVDSVATVLRYEGYRGRRGQPRDASPCRRRRSGRSTSIVLDVMLPDLDGLEVTRRIRADGLDVPILFLTAKSEVEDRVAGLTVGGDDYVSKPFSLIEIVARTKAILRRRQPPTMTGACALPTSSWTRTATRCGRGGQPVRLTATEFNLLRLFLLNPRHVLSKDQIIDHVWHYDFGGNQNIVETYVRYLRKKLDASGPSAHPHDPPRRLRAARGSMSRQLSLRTRLLLAVGAVALLALALADFAVYASLRSYLYSQVDATLQLSPHLGRTGGHGSRAAQTGSDRRPASSVGGSSNFCASGARALRACTSRCAAPTAQSSSGRRAPLSRRAKVSYSPELPSEITGFTIGPGDPDEPVVYFTVPSSVASGPLFRVRASKLRTRGHTRRRRANKRSLQHPQPAPRPRTSRHRSSSGRGSCSSAFGSSASVYDLCATSCGPRRR